MFDEPQDWPAPQQDQHHDPYAAWDFTLPKKLRSKLNEPGHKRLKFMLQLFVTVFIAVTLAGLTVGGISFWYIKTYVLK